MKPEEAMETLKTCLYKLQRTYFRSCRVTIAEWKNITRKTDKGKWKLFYDKVGVVSFLVCGYKSRIVVPLRVSRRKSDYVSVLKVSLVCFR